MARFSTNVKGNSMRYLVTSVSFAAILLLAAPAVDAQQSRSQTTTTTTHGPTKITTADEAMAAATAAGWTSVTGLTQKGKGAWHGMGIAPGGTAAVPVTVTPRGKVNQGDVDTDD
jgi:hypothetical protein